AAERRIIFIKARSPGRRVDGPRQGFPSMRTLRSSLQAPQELRLTPFDNPLILTSGYRDIPRVRLQCEARRRRHAQLDPLTNSLEQTLLRARITVRHQPVIVREYQRP